MQSLYADDFATHAGYLLGGFGTYGTDYVERAVISQIGLGAFVPQQAVYAMAWDDSSHAVLAGSSSYVLHLATPPPTTEGWSVTIYNLKGQLVAKLRGPLRAHEHVARDPQRRRLPRPLPAADGLPRRQRTQPTGCPPRPARASR